MSKNLLTKAQQDQLNRELGGAISLSVDMEANFKLYAYNCVTPEQFKARIKQLIDFYHKEIEPLKNTRDEILKESKPNAKSAVL